MFNLFSKKPTLPLQYFTCRVEEMSFACVNHHLKWSLWEEFPKHDKKLWQTVESILVDTKDLYPSQEAAGKVALKQSRRGCAGAAFYKEDGKLKVIVSAVLV